MAKMWKEKEKKEGVKRQVIKRRSFFKRLCQISTRICKEILQIIKISLTIKWENGQ